MLKRARPFILSRLLSKKPKGIKRRKSKKKRTKADFYRFWGMNPHGYIRYSGLKGVYWHFFSKFIRARDYKEHNGLCMTCLQFVEKGDDQCGHLFPARDCGFALLFHPKNNHLQHSKCNNPRFTPSAGVHNAINIEKRYGAGTLDTLAALKKQKTKEWSKVEYERRIKELPSYQQVINTVPCSNNCGETVELIPPHRKKTCFNCKRLRRIARMKISGPQYRMRKRLEKLEQRNASRP